MDDQPNYMAGVACPRCGQSVSVDVESTALVRLTTDNLEVLDDVFHLFEGARTKCFDCEYVGNFEEFMGQAEPSKPSPILTTSTTTYH